MRSTTYPGSNVIKYGTNEYVELLGIKKFAENTDR